MGKGQSKEQKPGEFVTKDVNVGEAVENQMKLTSIILFIAIVILFFMFVGWFFCHRCKNKMENWMRKHIDAVADPGY